AEGEDLDHRSDLFSLGGVLYRMCTGQLPFKGRNTMGMLHALATKTPIPPRELNPEIPPALSGLVLNLLQKDRDDRPGSAQVAANAREEIGWAPDPDPEPLEEAEEGFEVVETNFRPPIRRRKRPGGSRRAEEEDLWERRVMTLAWVAGIGVALLILFLIVRHR